MAQQDPLSTLSHRARQNLSHPDHWEPLVSALSNAWTPSNPDGTVILGIAENSLMQEELAAHIQTNFQIHPHSHLTYGHGPVGSPRLLSALANYFNSHFSPHHPTSPHEFLITAGVTALLDQVAWNLCDEGEAVLVPRPLYRAFTHDIPTRARGRIVGVEFDGGVEDVFDAEANGRAFERALTKCKEEGVRVKGVLITNPHNPLGKCYSKECLLTLLTFCAKHNLHYLSDEIYAQSVFPNPSHPSALPFTSVVSLDLSGVIDPGFVHVLYGAAKDFGANGLRLGVLWSRGEGLRGAVGRTAPFAWEAYVVQDMWARVLEDREFLDWFLAENRRRLAKHQKIVTDWLEVKKIPVLGGSNAGLFLWIDLRHLLLQPGDEFADLRANSSTKRAVAVREREKEFAKVCVEKGVMLARGGGFAAEEAGWFRLGFAVGEEALRTGLERLGEVLEGWKGGVTRVEG